MSTRQQRFGAFGTLIEIEPLNARIVVWREDQNAFDVNMSGAEAFLRRFEKDICFPRMRKSKSQLTKTLGVP
jgi:hypothetical protein